MSESDLARQKIIDSVFSRRNAAGNLEEIYVTHIKIWEDAPEGGDRKPRFILLSEASNGQTGYMHKSKLNSNGSFSVGKTWRLPELRGVSVVNPLSFSVSLTRTYRWETENQRDQSNFVVELVRLFRSVTQNAPLRIEGFRDPGAGPPAGGRQPVQADYMRPPSSSSGLPTPRRQRVQDQSEYDSADRGPSPALRTQSRAGGGQSRPGSPANSSRGGGYDARSSGRAPTPSRDRDRVASPTPSASTTVRPRPRRPSNAASSQSQIPSLNIPAVPPTPSRPSATSRPSKESTQSRSSSGRPSLDIPSGSQGRPSLEVPSPSPAISASQTSSRPSTGSRTVSPVPSSRTRNTPSRGNTPVPEAAPVTSSQSQPPKRDPNARVSFFDSTNQAMQDRLLVADPATIRQADGEEETALATMANVEEMLEGFEWASEDVMGRKKTRGAAELIEARLLDELMALEKANIHSFVESDDRINIVLKYLDDAMLELDSMDSLISSYKIHLNTVDDDITYIQSQNRGLQVQTQNQRALKNELENLLQTVHVDREALMTLSQESLEKSNSIQRLEDAATELYKALQAGRDNDMAATMERLDEYRTHNAQFCKRIFDFLSIAFMAQASKLLGREDGIVKTSGRVRATFINHEEVELYLGRYAGLMLYLKEMDESVYGKLCAAYFSAISELHSTQMKALFSTYAAAVKKGSEDDQDTNFGTTPTTSKAGAGIRRAGTIIRSPMDRRGGDKGDKSQDANLLASEAFSHMLEQIAPQIDRENKFITDFLQVNDAGLTFADYSGLDNYFRRQAARGAGLSQATMKLVRGAMDLIFGFLPAEIKSWLDSALAKDNMQIFGVIACVERFLADADEMDNPFFSRMLEKQQMRLKGLFDRHVSSQIKNVEQTKITSKKRKGGVAPFIKHFPLYIGRVENQLIGADGLEIRASVDAAYDKIVQTMFDSLKQMAKMDGEGEDKGQLNYHVILIENMHYFVAEIAQLEIGSVSSFLRRAEGIYDENLNAYVKLVLRKPFAKLIDYFEGVERLLTTTAPTEVASNSNYNKSALKKVVKEYNAKDVRKHVDALFKRVEKHFVEAVETQKTTKEETGGILPGTVMVGVWKACEDELLRITELFGKRITQCYSDSGVALDYTLMEVAAAFKRHRVGS